MNHFFARQIFSFFAENTNIFVGGRLFTDTVEQMALIIAEYQCDVLYRGEQLARADFLPLDAANWITCGKRCASTG